MQTKVQKPLPKLADNYDNRFALYSPQLKRQRSLCWEAIPFWPGPAARVWCILSSGTAYSQHTVNILLLLKHGLPDCRGDSKETKRAGDPLPAYSRTGLWADYRAAGAGFTQERNTCSTTGVHASRRTNYRDPVIRVYSQPGGKPPGTPSVLRCISSAFLSGVIWLYTAYQRCAKHIPVQSSFIEDNERVSVKAQAHLCHC